MHRSSHRFSTALLAASFTVFGALTTASNPAVAAPVASSLGGPEAALVAPEKSRAPRPTYSANAQTVPAPGTNVPPAGVPAVPGVDYSSATDKGGTLAQPPAALGPAPFDLGKIKRVQVGNLGVREQPLRVGNLDVLAPLVEELPRVGATVTSVDPRNIPSNASTSKQEQFFQINLPRGAPIVMAVGRSTAYMDGNEITLRAAPLLIDRQIWLPIFSIAPLMGAATRLNPQGTLYLTPTVQSVELFPVGDTIAVTIKTSMPVPNGAYKITKLGGARPQSVIEFSGFSMGFDAGNSTMERLVAPGQNSVKGVRAAQSKFFPDATNIVLDFKAPLNVALQKFPDDPTIFALVLSPPNVAPPRVPDDQIDPPSILETPDGGEDFTPPASKPLLGLTIIVDAGHGGHDTGAPGAFTKEKDDTLDIAKRLAKILSYRGANALLTRSNDTYVTLQGRVDFANSRNADLFISVHMNSNDNRGSNGTETFFFTPQSQYLAREIHRELLGGTGRKSRGVSQARFFVIRKTAMPSVLLECAFISNPTEEKIASDPAWRERVAQSVTRGVVNYVAKYGGRTSSG